MQGLEVKKIVSFWEMYKRIEEVPGQIIECGVFKGRSLLWLAKFREFYNQERKIVAFDTFDKFPAAGFEGDKVMRDQFIRINGGMSDSTDEIRFLLLKNDCDFQIELVAGDICKTVPEYLKYCLWLRIALLHIDCDLYEPTKVILNSLFPLVNKEGIVVLDDYNIFPGETKAADEYCGEHGLSISYESRLHYYYIKKE